MLSQFVHASAVGRTEILILFVANLGVEELAELFDLCVVVVIVIGGDVGVYHSNLERL